MLVAGGAGGVGEAIVRPLLDGARALRDRVVGERERIDVLIPSLGDVTIDVWDAIMNEMLRTHFLFTHIFLPVLREQSGAGRNLGIGGGAAYHPIRNASLVSIAAASQLTMTRALRLENDDRRIDILELAETGATFDPSTQTAGAIVRLRPTKWASTV